jgi:2,3-bisphosphoglycerate-independent phosphoglycerate mutase
LIITNEGRKMEKFVALIILDGFGYSPEKNGNAIALANTPFFDSLLKNYPNGLLKADGEAVGLPEGQMGNSEVGHMNIGAGRIVWQDIVRISKSIESGDFFKNPVINKLFQTAKEKNKKVHLVGLLSDGGVHSHINHLFALLKLAKEYNVKTCIHAILDGRDTPPKSAEKYVKQLVEKLPPNATVGTLGGRYYYMDRDKRWDRTKKAYDTMTIGTGKTASSPLEAIKIAYSNGETDEFVEPFVIDKSALVEDGDVIFFFNFRADRMRQIVSAFGFEDFKGFKREKFPKTSYIATMTLYDKTFPFEVAFPPQNLKNVIGEVISNLGEKQLRIAETEKYAHVTYFLNGGREEPFEGENRILIPSPKVPTYDLKPEMSAYEVTDKACEEILKNNYKLCVINFANPDMVGHTGKLEPTIKAVEAVDKCLEKLVKTVLNKGGTCVITGDHGNAEKMKDNDHEWTAHTTNPVPFIVVSKENRYKLKRVNHENLEMPEEFGGRKILGILADISPTILKLLGVKIPEEMEGKPLIED